MSNVPTYLMYVNYLFGFLLTHYPVHNTDKENGRHGDVSPSKRKTARKGLAAMFKKCILSAGTEMALITITH